MEVLMKRRLAALILPLALLVPAGAAAQSTPSGQSTPSECFILGGFLTGATCPDTDGDAAELKAAQARWDAIAADIGKALATLWLGPRPKTLDDVWWLPSQ
jgi:hypothetical protein